ncbi:MAG: hypothetical protein M1814_004105 [Vezdaea aestivalis]|nr:MAG: hypothetical protein M1814_004105 [Vezdaea aestivalis]
MALATPIVRSSPAQHYQLRFGQDPLFHFTANPYNAMATLGPDIPSDSLKPDSSYGSGESSESRSPINMSLGFLRNLTDKKTTRDGQTPKRRGPKPDSKPALTRRQELNRQAQRTHRERKEIYVKDLENKVIRLTQLFTDVTNQRDRFSEENKRLKLTLDQHGINVATPDAGWAETLPMDLGSSSGSISGSYANGSSSQGLSPPSGPGAHAPPLPSSQGAGGSRRPGIDYDAVGTDFVLTLEQPCRDHMQPLMVRARYTPETEISGHALMMSCPPGSHIMSNPNDIYPNKAPDLKLGDLMNLFDAGQRLKEEQKLDRELTPILAWGVILSHPQFHDFTTADFLFMRDQLKQKVRCYGFGAVLEEFEVLDTMTNVITNKFESYDIFIG